MAASCGIRHDSWRGGRIGRPPRRWEAPMVAHRVDAQRPPSCGEPLCRSVSPLPPSLSPRPIFLFFSASLCQLSSFSLLLSARPSGESPPHTHSVCIREVDALTSQVTRRSHRGLGARRNEQHVVLRSLAMTRDNLGVSKPQCFTALCQVLRLASSPDGFPKQLRTSWLDGMFMEVWAPGHEPGWCSRPAS